MEGDDDDEPIETGEPRVRYLVKAGTLPVRAVAGEPMWDRVAQPRLAWRAVGCSKRLWMRVTGEDPFVGPERAVLTRRTVYVDGRFVRIDRAAAEVAPKKAERGDGNKGEALIPEGFRSLPVGKPAPTAPPKAAAKRPAPPPPPPPERTYSATGRMRGTVRRTPSGMTVSEPVVAERSAAAAAGAPPAGPASDALAQPVASRVSTEVPPISPARAGQEAAPPSLPVSSPSVPPEGASRGATPSAETLDDVMGAPKDGRVRLKPRR